MLALALSLLVLGADAPSAPNCMTADLLLGALKNGKPDQLVKDDGATMLCITTTASGISFSFGVKTSKGHDQYTSPPLTVLSGTEADHTNSAVQEDGHRWGLRVKTNLISACVLNEPAKFIACAIVVIAAPDAGTPKKP